MGSAVQQQQRAGSGLQLLLQPLHALTRHHHHSHDHRASPQMINFHQGNVNPPLPWCDTENNTTELREKRKITALNFPSRGRHHHRRRRRCCSSSCGRAHTRNQNTLPHTHPHPTRKYRCPSGWSRKLEHAEVSFPPSFSPIEVEVSLQSIDVHLAMPAPTLTRPQTNKMAQRCCVSVL